MITQLCYKLAKQREELSTEENQLVIGYFGALKHKAPRSTAYHRQFNLQPDDANVSACPLQRRCGFSSDSRITKEEHFTGEKQSSPKKNQTNQQASL